MHSFNSVFSLIFHLNCWTGNKSHNLSPNKPTNKNKVNKKPPEHVCVCYVDTILHLNWSNKSQLTFATSFSKNDRDSASERKLMLESKWVAFWCQSHLWSHFFVVTLKEENFCPKKKPPCSWPMAMGTVFESEVAAETSGTFLPLFSFFHFVCISKLSTFLVEQICASVWWNILASSYDDVSVGGALNTNRTQIYVLTGSQKAPTKKHNKTEMKINRKAIISSFVRFERKCEEMKQKIERMKKELHF